MSMAMSVLSVANKLMAPPVPAGTMAAFAVIAPVGAFSVETNGWLCGSAGPDFVTELTKKPGVTGRARMELDSPGANFNI
jgi:hypothetical protein